MTRFQEEFVDEDRCRDIPIKDCKNVQSEVCSEQQELVCEPQHTEDCQIVPHEECQHIVEKIPKKVSKKITKVVCDENEEGEEPTEVEDESSNTDDSIINNIFEIFGINNTGENEIDDEKPEFVPVITTTEFMVDDGLLSESTIKTTTTSTMAPTTTKTTTTTTTTTITTTTTTTLKTSTVRDSENIPTMTTEVRRMDGSKIIFSDHELDARNKDLASRVYLNVVPTRQTSTESAPRTSEDPHSRIFFPE